MTRRSCRDGVWRTPSTYLMDSHTQDSTDSDATILQLEIPETHKATFWLKENNVNAVTFLIHGSMNLTTWEELKGVTDLAKNGSTYETLGDAWRFVRVQIKTKTSPNHGNVTCYILAVL